MSISLYYHFLCPFSKQIAVLLSELGLEYQKNIHDFWKPSKQFQELSIWGEMPVMIAEKKIIIGIYACTEYIIDFNRNHYLFSGDLTDIRQVINWFNKHLYNQVTKAVIYEKLVKTFMPGQYIDTQKLRKAQNDLHQHMIKIGAIINIKDYLATDDLSFADIVAACHLAVIDYFGCINWEMYPEVQRWYSIIKSRPIFRADLEGEITGINPASTYFKLDF